MPNFAGIMEFIDTHTHISDEAFEGCRDEIVRRALDAGVTTMLQADVDSSERDAMYALCEQYPGSLRPMLGLYPGSVGEDWRDEVDKLMPWLEKGPVAVGEIGLDYHYGADTKGLQNEAFRTQLELALQWNLPVNIHLREATEDFFRMMDGFKGRGLRGNLHAFSGSYETFCRLQKYGDWLVGIGGVMTFKKASIGEDVKKIPLDRILLETDAPYLTPVPFRGTRNESSMIPVIAADLAARKGVDTEEVAFATTRNARLLFNLGGGQISK